MLTSFRVVLVLSSLLGLSFAAPAALVVLPPAPTSENPVTLYAPSHGCSISSETVTRTGRNIRVVLTSGGCPSPPLPGAVSVELGVLPAGEYDVELTYDDEPATGSFIVLEANPKVTVRPFVVPTNTSGMLLQITFAEDFDHCAGSQLCTIDIGGVQYSGATPLYAPDLEPGLHDLRVISDKGTYEVPAAIYYQAPGAEPHPAIYERVLFPVLFRSDGVNGSQWRSEAVISNPTPFPIQNANSVGPHAPRLEPRTRVAFGGEHYPYGVALMVPRKEADNLAFRLRVRDVSREADSFGTEVPVVRETDLVRDAELTLLDVPLDPRYRTKLRVYVFPTPAFSDSWGDYLAGVRIVFADGTQGYPVARFQQRNCTGAACAWTPRTMEIDLPARAEGERADVYVSMGGSEGWAFASVTNNKTQQVTIVTPDGLGGHPQ